MMRIQKSLLLSVFFAIASAHAGLAWGAGKVHFARGDVSALDRAGESRPLAKGDGIDVGDTVVVGAAALAQLKFTDGALVSLQPESSFRVDDYHYEGKIDGNEKGSFSLLRGGMRTITGAVGRQNRDNYKVDAVVATIGIRGTEYTARLDASAESLGVHTGEGLIEVCNALGCLQLASGESGSVTIDRRPLRTAVRPQLPPPTVESSAVAFFSTSETRAPSGEHVGIAEPPPALESGSGFQVAFVSEYSDIGNAIVEAEFGGDSSLLAFKEKAEEDGFEASYRLGDDSETISSSASGVIGWGYWEVTQIEKWGDSWEENHLHYAIGKPTAINDLVSLGGLRASYAFIGGTPLMGTDGNTGELTGGELVVNFTGGSIDSTSLALEGVAGGVNFFVPGAGSAGRGATFSSDSDSGIQYEGFLAGPGASHAGVAFEFNAADDTFKGAAAFERGLPDGGVSVGVD